MSEILDLATQLGTNVTTMDNFVEAVRTAIMFVQDDNLRKRYGFSLEEARGNGGFLVLGKPGIGKTDGVRTMLREMDKEAEKQGIRMKKYRYDENSTAPDHMVETGETEPLKWNLIAIRLGQLGVGELSGIPDPSKQMKLTPYDRLPRRDRDGEYGVLFLDELTSAELLQSGPAGSLCDSERGINGYKLPPRWIVIAAGNDPQCKNFIMLNAMTISRFGGGVFLIDAEFDSWYKWAIKPFEQVNEEGEVETGKGRIISQILAYLRKYPERMHGMTEDYLSMVDGFEKDVAPLFACPRTWTGLSTAIRKKVAMSRIRNPRATVAEIIPDMQEFAQAYIGKDSATEFAAFWDYNKYCVWSSEDILEGIAPLLYPDELPYSDTDPELAERYQQLLHRQMDAATKAAEIKRVPVYDMKEFVEFVKRVGTKQQTSTLELFKDVLFIVVEELIQDLIAIFSSEEDKSTNGGFSKKSISSLANAINWILNTKNKEFVNTCVESLKDAVPEVATLLQVPPQEFRELCPLWDIFVADMNKTIESYQ